MKHFSALAVFTALATLSACHTTQASTAIQPPQTATVSAPSMSLKRLAESAKVQAAFASIEAQREATNALMVELTEIPAPPFQEEVRAARFVELLKSYGGFADVTIDAEGNVIARRPGTSGGKTLALLAHIDTVFPMETDVTVTREGDLYTAPGIADNSRALAVLLNLAKAMNTAGLETQGDLLFVGTVGEEGLGDLRGVKHLFRKSGPKIDRVISVDGGSTDRIIHSAVGSQRYRITFKGPGGHSWGNFGDANPHHALAHATSLFSERALKITADGPKSSFSVGRIGGGTSINSIPFESWMEVDMRSGDVSKLDALDAVFQTAVKDGLKRENATRTSGPALTVDIDRVGSRPAGETPVSASLVQNAIQATMLMGITPTLRSSSTDSNIPISLGIPAVTMSRGGRSQGAHSLAEHWEDVDSSRAIQILLLTLLAEDAQSIAP